MRPLKSLIVSAFIFFVFFQAKAQYDFTVDETEGCAPLKVKFTFVSTATTDSVDTYYWSFGNGNTSYDMDPDTAIFETEGVFDPTLVLVFSGGSEQWIVKPDLITTHASTPADFDYTVSAENLLYYVFEQNTVPDTATNYDFSWEVAGEDYTNLTEPRQEITFPRIDTFLVTMTLTNQFGCASSVSKIIAVIDKIEVPNFFTPGGDQINDYFIIRSKDDIPLRIKIFSRTGILVYESEGPVISWNGETASGDKLKTGIYYYSLEAINGDPLRLYTKTGFIHMYRKE